MAYTAPTITSSGMTIPSYTDIVNQLVADAQNIFGSDIYLGPDTQDYQWISAFAQMIYDSFLTAQAVYNSRGPATAVGSGLDIIVGINGLTRLPAVYSTVPATLVGTANTTITNGVVSDVNGNYWSLPTTVVIPSGGSITVTATCQTSGAITANQGDISTIVTPTLGWTSVTNSTAATVGSSQETDAALRARQAVSTAQPSQSIIEGLKGALAAISGVTRYVVYENDATTADANGVPAHSICAVVEGGSYSDIGTAIFNHKGPGTGTYGTTTQAVTDSYGVTTNINYDVLGYEDIDVAITVKKLAGYSDNITTSIQSAISSYLSSVQIGTTVYLSQIWGAALSANATPSNPTFSVVSVQAAIHLGATLTTALTSGTAYTSLSVSALTQPVTSGDNLVLTMSANTQTVQASANAAVGATSISVNSFTANAAYDTTTTVSFQPGTSDISVPFNKASRGNTSYITVTTQ